MKKHYTRLFSAFFVMALLFPMIMNAGNKDYEIEQIKKNIPKLYGANNVGKEFWLTVPTCFEDESGGNDNFIKVFVTSPYKTLIKVEVPGRGYLIQKPSIANDVIEFNLSPVIAVPYTKNGSTLPPPEKVYSGAGIHVTGDAPFVCYVVVRYRYTSDGYLGIPVSSLGREYISAAYGQLATTTIYLPSECNIVAPYDKTVVKFTLGGNTVTKSAGGMRPGDTKTVTLDKGDVWAFSSHGQAEGDLTGSKIIASKPVGVVSGNMCTNIPTTNRWCDYTCEMDLPMYAWGTVLHVPMVPNRKYPSLIRIFAKEANTKIYRDGKQIGIIPKSGGIMDQGYLEMRMSPDNEPPRSVSISGDKPISVTLYNCGVEEDGYPMPNSDPFIMAITPIEQYQKEITFCTPGINGGQNFPENYLNIVYETDSGRVMPEDMEFAQVSAGQFIWSKLKTKFSGADEDFRLSPKGKDYAVKNIKLPGDGVYKIRCSKPFAAYSFGYGYCDSYGYPTSAALMDLEKPDTVAPDPKWKQNCDGSVKSDGANGKTATVTDRPDDPDVRSNLAIIDFNVDLSYNYLFNYDVKRVFIPGETVTTDWTLEVVNKYADAKAVITFSDRRGNDTTIIIEYFAPQVVIHPLEIDWGRLKVGDSKKYDMWAVNNSKTAPVEINLNGLQKYTPGFKLINLPSSFVIPPKDSIKFEAEFVATTEGTYKDSIGLGYMLQSPDTCWFLWLANLKASVGEPIINMKDIDFGEVPVNTQQSKDYQIENQGSVELKITDYNGPTLSVYNNDLQKPTLTTPLYLPAGKGSNLKNVTVYFTPTAVGVYNDTVFYVSDAGQKIKPYCAIHGIGIKSDLTATGYDWKRRRIDRPALNGRPAFPGGPYSVPADTMAVKLTNAGTQDCNITDLKITVVSGDAASFIFNRADIDGKTIAKGSSMNFDVKFQPKTVGEHEIQIEYVNTANAKAVSILKGVGTMPKIEITPFVDFDTTLVNDKDTQMLRQITFKNAKYDYSDDLTINDLAELPAGGIGTTWNAYGTEGFKYSKNTIAFPLILSPDSSYTFDAEFLAQKLAQSKATLTTVSDAEADATSNWVGFGLDQLMSTKNDSTVICYGDQTILNCSIKNDGTKDIKVLSISFLDNEMFFKNSTDAQGFTLKVGETFPLDLNYNPQSATAGTNYVPKRIVVTTDRQVKPIDTITVYVRALQYARTTSVVEIKTDEQKKRLGYYIGEEIQVDVNLNNNNGTSIAIAQVKQIDFVVNFDNGFMNTEDSKVKLNPALSNNNNYSLVLDTIDKGQGIIRFSVKANGANVIDFSNGQNLVNIRFNTYLSKTEYSTARVYHSCIIGDINSVSTTCALLSPEDTVVVRILPVCEDTIRRIIVSPTKYYMTEVVPNPVGSNGANIEFGVGLEGFTQVSIVNSMGEVVAVLMSEVLSPGSYSVKLPIDKLSNGAYMVQMISGPSKQVVPLIISK